jgi:hypothetical protein
MDFWPGKAKAALGSGERRPAKRVDPAGAGRPWRQTIPTHGGVQKLLPRCYHSPPH